MKNYVFSWDRMLATDGNTSVYLQYAHARIHSIFRKAGVSAADAAAFPIEVRADAERGLVLALVQVSDVVAITAAKLEPHHLCTWLYDLATAYTRFWDTCPVLKADSEAQRGSRLALCAMTARALALGMDLLGIEAPERM